MNTSEALAAVRVAEARRGNDHAVEICASIVALISIVKLETEPRTLVEVWWVMKLYGDRDPNPAVKIRSGRVVEAIPFNRIPGDDKRRFNAIRLPSLDCNAKELFARMERV